MSKKRDLPYQQQLMLQQPQHPPGGLQNPNHYWNAKSWDWDCTMFVAKPVGGNEMNLDAPSQVVHPVFQNQGVNNGRNGDEDDGSLCLKLGSGSSSSEETAMRPGKRIRARSPAGNGHGNGVNGNGNHPTCQVDSCTVNLSTAKDYHRRHKVCEAHSKASQALVAKKMQRFCQQCSRFHVLSEFDEGKRSCRRRLAGHNRRRRKTQPDDVTSQLLAAGGQENAANTGLNLANLLAAITCTKGNQENNNGAAAVVPDKEKEQLVIKFINQLKSVSQPIDAAMKLPVSENLEKTAGGVSPEHQSGSSANSSSQSTLNLLGVVSHTSPDSAPDAVLIPTQRSSESSDSEKTKSADNYQPDPLIWRKQPTVEISAVGGERSSNSCQYPVDDMDSQVHDTQANLPLLLFLSSSENNSPPKLAASSKYFSSDSSNQNEYRSPSSSPGVELFPVKPSKQTVKPDRTCHGLYAIPQADSNRGGALSFDLFGGSNKGVEVDFFQRSPNQAGYASPGSCSSPSSSTCGAQDLTGKISFKLFDKDPSHLPGSLRTEILSWLSHGPSQMESYIRPGCIVLSIYVSMPPASWENLEKKLLQHVSWLLQRTEVDIWRDGRFLVQTGKQTAFCNSGKSRLCKSRVTPKAPELISASPLAIVGGHETRIHLRGRNLSHGTKLHYTHLGGYISKEISDLTVQDSTCDGTRLCSCEIHVAAPSGAGRFFIEVENGFRGNSFPIIIADSSICRELRQLEFEFEADVKVSDSMSEDQGTDALWSTMEVLHFLNELGWLLQKKGNSSNALEYSVHRFKFLLTFSVEKDFSAVVKLLLDALVEEKIGTDGIPVEVSEMVSDVQLLHRAVKRRCRKMVEMLVNYFIVRPDLKPSKIYAFPPNLLGPGGLTPLHIAACTSGSEDIVDALTNDPLEVGLSSWESQLDASGQSPFAYAVLRNNHSYNQLVSRKLTDRRNNQISLSIENNTMEQAWVQPSPAASHHLRHRARSCTQCAAVTARCNRNLPGSHGMVARPFILSMLAIAAVCVCVCLYYRGHPETGMRPFVWEHLDYGTI